MTSAAVRLSAQELSELLDLYLDEFMEPTVQEIKDSVGTPRFDDIVARTDRLLAFRERVRKLAGRPA
jgi:hypothetical protein